MKLSELSDNYSAEARAIHERILELQERLAQTNNPIEVHTLQRRIGDLRPLWRQTAELANLTKHYYEGGFYRDPKFTI